jgi:hypothetical protein
MFRQIDLTADSFASIGVRKGNKDRIMLEYDIVKRLIMGAFDIFLCS